MRTFMGLLVALALSSATSSYAAEDNPVQCPRFEPGSEGLPTRGEFRTHPAVGDVNGDGHPDIAAHMRKSRGPRVFLGDGAGNWREASKGLAVPGAGCGVGVDLGDVNGDGKLDLAVADHCRGLFVFLNDGKGGWRLAPLVEPFDRRGIEDVALADVDADGNLDLVAGATSRGGITFFAGDGTGSFERRELGLPKRGYAKNVKLGDIDGDGRLDVAASYSANRSGPEPGTPMRNAIWLSAGNGKYEPGSTGLPDREGQFTAVALADIDGDDALDLALTATYVPGRPSLLVYRNEGDGLWAPSNEGLFPAIEEKGDWDPFFGVELADLNGDANADLVAVGFRDARIELFLGDGKGGWHRCTDTGLLGERAETRGWGVAVADLNHDGKSDIVAGFGRNGKGALEAWLQQ